MQVFRIWMQKNFKCGDIYSCVAFIFQSVLISFREYRPRSVMRQGCSIFISPQVRRLSHVAVGNIGQYRTGIDGHRTLAQAQVNGILRHNIRGVGKIRFGGVDKNIVVHKDTVPILSGLP